MLDLRFATATQLMLSLALAEEEGASRVSSAQLAEGLGVASSFVRKLVVPLVKDGLIAASMGKHGGLELSRPARELSLRDVYASVTDSKPLWNSRVDGAHRCLVTSSIAPFFSRVAAEAHSAVLEVLARRSLQDSLDEMRQIELGKPPGKGVYRKTSKTKPGRTASGATASSAKVRTS